MQTLTFQQEKWHGWLRRKVGNAVDAAKLAQDAFLRLLTVPARHLMPVQGLHEPRAYLATGARRRRLKHLRRQSLEQSQLAALVALPEPQAPPPEQQLSSCRRCRSCTPCSAAGRTKCAARRSL